jgi:hypothetical protein
MELEKVENSLYIEGKPLCLEWVGTSGALVCGDN